MTPKLRRSENRPFVTDGGNYIVDCTIAGIPDPAALEKNLAAIVGIIESGIFITLASTIIVGSADGVMLLGKTLKRAATTACFLYQRQKRRLDVLTFIKPSKLFSSRSSTGHPIRRHKK